MFLISLFRGVGSAWKIVASLISLIGGMFIGARGFADGSVGLLLLGIAIFIVGSGVALGKIR